MTKILAFSGSLRKESFNTKILAHAIEGAEAAGATVTRVNLADLDIPLMDQDLEDKSGIPADAKKFKQMLIEHDGMLIASPEYNSSITPALKNAIDWATRPEKGEKPLVAFAGKHAGLVAASGGALGGLRGLFHVREILQNIMVTVIPNMLAVSKVDTLLDDNGRITDEQWRGKLENVGKALAETIAKQKG